MIWLGLEDGPRTGINWDIFFHPVIDKEGRPVMSTFVIVIVVARYPGGVFFQEPESYHIVNYCVERMELDTWKEYLFSKRSHNEQILFTVKCGSRVLFRFSVQTLWVVVSGVLFEIERDTIISTEF